MTNLIGKRGPQTIEEKESRRIKTQALRLNRYLNTPFDQLGPENRKRRILEEQQGKCNHCGIFEWNNKQLTLELEHIDGNTQNNERTNLECICPNCHSQTSTWRGRNNKGRYVSDELLLKTIETHKTVSEALRSLGLPDKGTSHTRATKLVEKNKL
jgi:hypothetical protein